MAASFLYNCPYCKGINCSFIFKQEVRSTKEPFTWHLLVECAVCKDIGAAELFDLEAAQKTANPGDTPMTVGEFSVISDRYAIVKFLPVPIEIEISEHLPEKVAKPLREAEVAYQNAIYSAAGACYRKAMERAIKEINPDATGMLNARIRQLEKMGLLPPSMIDLLDRVRLFGNDAMHEDDIDPTEIDCTSAREFAKLFLTFTFEMPAKISLAKKTASN
jgi:hypothetical protein